MISAVEAIPDDELVASFRLGYRSPLKGTLEKMIDEGKVRIMNKEAG